MLSSPGSSQLTSSITCRNGSTVVDLAINPKHRPNMPSNKTDKGRAQKAKTAALEDQLRQARGQQVPSERHRQPSSGHRPLQTAGTRTSGRPRPTSRTPAAAASAGTAPAGLARRIAASSTVAWNAGETTRCVDRHE